ENAESSVAASNLEDTLYDLIALLRAGDRDPQPLHERFRANLEVAANYADKPEERALVGQLGEIWQHYLRIREAPSATERESALKVLEREGLPTCHQLHRFNSQQVTNSGLAHRRTAQLLMLGLIGVGTLGSFAGLALGYSVARALRHSIYHLSVRVQDAANKLGQDLPAVSVQEEGDLQHLHEQMRGVVHEI